MVKFKKKNHTIYFSKSPLKILKFESQFCKCNIAKSIKAKDLKPVLADLMKNEK